MAGYTYSTEREKPTTTITIPSKDLIQNWPRNQKLYRQAEIKRIQHHQTSFATNTKGTYIASKDKRKERPTKTTPNNQENANRNICINNHIKYKQMKCTNQKIETD